jgi:membrane protein DedA with SNARE-associated domain
MSYSRFIFIDFLGVLISVPASIFLGKIFGDSIDTLRKSMHDLHLWLALGVVALALILILRSKWRGRDK